MKKGPLLYQGKAKKLYETDQENLLLAEYIDQATALNGLKKDRIEGKGELNNRITGLIFDYLRARGIRSHYVENRSSSEQLVRRLSMFPLEVVIRNATAGSFAKRFGLEEGIEFPFPVLEFYYKKDELDDPFLNEDQIAVLELATKDEVGEIKEKALVLNEVLKEMFKSGGIRLIDLKLEFGRTAEGEILLADEISPDTCRLWDLETGGRLDKDLYRRDLGDIIPVYREVLQRLSHLSGEQ